MLRSVWLRVKALFKRRQLERDLRDEIALHLEMRAANPHGSFGNLTLVQESLREMWTFGWLERRLQDLRYVGRMMRRNPGFASVIVLTLTLGIGANTAIFSLFDATVLDPLPYRDPSRLVMLWGNVKRERVERRGTSLPDYADWRDRSHSFEALAFFMDSGFTLHAGGEPEPVRGEIVAQPYFRLLGIEPVLGRTFRPEEDEVPQRDNVVVIGQGLWKRRFGSDPAIIGRPLRLDDTSYQIVGVLPEWFRGIGDTAELWIPLNAAATPEAWTERGSRGPSVLGKLKAGVSLEAAQSELSAIARQLEQEYPRTNEGRGVELAPLAQEAFGNVRGPVLVLMSAVVLVLLIASTNVANLFLARSESRQREIAVRVSLGASRARVLGQLVTESMVLSFLGAGLGFGLAAWGTPVLMAASPIALPSFVQPSVNWRVALFTFAVTGCIGLALGLAPALHVLAGKLTDVFKRSSRQFTAGRAALRFRHALVGAQFAFAMLLLVGAGLLMRSLQQLSAIRPGYDASHVLALGARLDPPPGETIGDARAFTRAAAVRAREILRHVAAAPSVEAVALGSDAPLRGGSAVFYTAEGQPPVTAQDLPRAYIHEITPDFFATLRIPFVAGRAFDQMEAQSGPGSVIVSEALARRFWPGQDAVDKRIKLGRVDSDAPWLTIVGVVNDMKYRALPENPTADPDVFVPLSERARAFTFVVRTSGDPAVAAPGVRAALLEQDPNAIVVAVEPLSERVAMQTARRRFVGWLMTVFAGAALLLAVIGIYGVMSYIVSRRTAEIGIRMALGASRPRILGLIASSGMAVIVVGLACGLAGSLALSRAIESLLYGVTANDLPTYASAAFVLAIAAAMACLVPAWRACRIPPAMVLRDE